MGRWTQYDEDDYRLPEGTKRVGYDADTQQYTFQKGNQLWQGAPGSKYGGQSARAGTVSHTQDDDELVSDPVPGGRSDGYQALPTDHGAPPIHSNHTAYRMIFPFMLLVGVFLLVVWRFVGSPSSDETAPQKCPGASSTYRVRDGDSCWEIARIHETTIEALRNTTLNPGLDCEQLRPGDILCIPDNKE